MGIYARITSALLTYLEQDRNLVRNNKTHLEHDWESLNRGIPHCVATDCE